MNICYVCEQPKDKPGMCPECQQSLLHDITREVNGDRRKEDVGYRVERRILSDVAIKTLIVQVRVNRQQ